MYKISLGYHTQQTIQSKVRKMLLETIVLMQQEKTGTKLCSEQNQKVNKSYPLDLGETFRIYFVNRYLGGQHSLIPISALNAAATPKESKGSSTVFLTLKLKGSSEIAASMASSPSNTRAGPGT